MALFLAAAPQRAIAQTTNYSQSVSQFPNLVGPYMPRHVAQPDFANSDRINQLMRDGKLYLSLDDAIALALENNLDLAIARYNLPIADTDILRAKAGASTRGVNTGLVQGTPGGGVGTIGAGGIGATSTGAGAGGTTAAAGGAGAGAAGLVSSTLGVGPPIGSYDPILTSTLSIEHLVQPAASLFAPSATALNSGTANFSWTQSLPTGTTYSVAFNNQRQTSNNPFTEFTPLISSGMRITFTQHLLQGLSINANRRFIRIAKNNREISDVAFRSQAINTVAQIENIYWDLVSAYDDVRVKERSLALAQKTLSDNKKQVEIGTLAPIEVTRAESVVASGQQDLIVSQTNLQLQQLLMKNALTRNMDDAQLASAPAIPTSTMELPAQEPVVPIQDLINDALQHSPDLAQARIDLVNRNITQKAARNELLPTVDLVTWYGSNALAGNTNPLTPICPTNEPFCVQPSQIQASGFGDAFTSLFGYDHPDYAVGFSINIPIRNRAAQADQVRSELEYRQAQMSLQQSQNRIAISVRNAQFAVQQNRARVEAANSTRRLAAESLDAEQKKYALGASTNTLVLQAQRDLAQAEATVVTAMAAYVKSKVELDRVMGLTLTHNGIEIGDVESGRVTRMPRVPGVLPRTEQLEPPSMQPPAPLAPRDPRQPSEQPPATK